MKKVVLTAIALFAFGFANAQEVKFGAKAGLNLSSLSGGDGMKAGAHVGGIAEIKFNEKIALQPELMYSMEGGEYSYSGFISGSVPYTFEQEIKLNKIILPIMFKYFVIPNLSLEVGPQLDYIISGDSEAVLSAPGQKISENADLDDSSTTLVLTDASGAVLDTGISSHDFDLKKLNFGINFGAGYQLASGLFFEARYNLGLTDFTTNANFLGSSIDGGSIPDITKSGESFKNSNIQISLGYKF